MAHMDTPHPASLDDLKANTQVLAFDIFGTVVDWHGSIVREVQSLYPSVDANAFALAWRAGYQLRWRVFARASWVGRALMSCTF
jgi:2-haloacid dehalogenase